MSRQQLSGEIAYQEGQSRNQVHRWRAFAVLAVSFFMTVADLAIVNVALPTIGRKLHMPESALQWVVTGYALTFGGFLLLGGRAADLLGRRRILMAGLAVFTAASLGCGLATAEGFLIATRFLQGLGAAIVLPAALSLVMNMFPEGAERNKALGVWGAIGASGAAVGVMAGGLLTRYAGWQHANPRTFRNDGAGHRRQPGFRPRHRRRPVQARRARRRGRPRPCPARGTARPARRELHPRRRRRRRPRGRRPAPRRAPPPHAGPQRRGGSPATADPPANLADLQPQLGSRRAARVQLDPRGAAASPAARQRGHRHLQRSRGQRLAAQRRLRRSQGRHPVHRLLRHRRV